MTHRWLIAAFLLALSVVARAAEAPAAADTPELKVLDRYVGLWEGTLVVKKGPWTSQEQNAATKVSAARVLGGRYVQLNASGSDGVEGMLMLTYDTARRHYVSWRWTSRGHHNTTQGEWFEQTRTMIWSGTMPGDFTIKTVERFPTDDTREFETVVKNADGAVMLEMSAKLTWKK